MSDILQDREVASVEAWGLDFTELPSFAEVVVEAIKAEGLKPIRLGYDFEGALKQGVVRPYAYVLFEFTGRDAPVRAVAMKAQEAFSARVTYSVAI